MPDLNVVVTNALLAELGEGLHWCASEQVLWLTDIAGRRVWRWHAPHDRWDSWNVGERVGWVLPVTASAGVQLLGLQRGFALGAFGADPASLYFVAQPFGDETSLRLNDAKADSTGAVWAGSLNNDDESRSDGVLFRLAPDGSLKAVDTGYTVANGPAISPDESLMLHTDSGRRTIYAFDLDVVAGEITNKRIWKRFSEEEGYPDGMCFDAEGAVWVAHWGGACISRFAADGRLLRRVSLPTSHITNVCFGGDGLDRLFVTSARAGLSEAQLAAQPLAGALFELLEPGVCGLPGRPARIEAVPKL